MTSRPVLLTVDDDPAVSRAVARDLHSTTVVRRAELAFWPLDLAALPAIGPLYGLDS